MTQLVSTVLLTGRVRRLTGAPSWRASGRLVSAAAVAAVVAAAVMVVLRSPFGTARGASVLAVAVAGSVGVAVFGAIVVAAGGVRPAQLLPGGRRAACVSPRLVRAPRSERASRAAEGWTLVGVVSVLVLLAAAGLGRSGPATRAFARAGVRGDRLGAGPAVG